MKPLWLWSICHNRMAASVGVASNIDGRVGEQGEVNHLKAVQNKARPNSTKHSRVFF